MRENGDPAYTLEAEHSHGIAIYDMTHADEVVRPVTGGKSNTLNARMGTGGNQVPIIAYSIAGNIIGREEQNGGHQMGIRENVSFTLNTVDRHAVFCVGNGQLHQANPKEKAGALNCMHDQQTIIDKRQRGSAYPSKSFSEYQNSDKAATLRASGGNQGGGSENLAVQNGVRKFTPLECERLQGLPDGFTLIPDKTCSDTARYKALGNGMAQPCADFIIRRIAQTMRMEAAGGGDKNRTV